MKRIESFPYNQAFTLNLESGYTNREALRYARELKNGPSYRRIPLLKLALFLRYKLIDIPRYKYTFAEWSRNV